MYFLILTLALLASEPATPFDSTVYTQCVEQQMDYDTVSSSFATLYSAFFTIEERGRRPIFNCLYGGYITVDSLERYLKCLLPKSPITEHHFRICAAYRILEADTAYVIGVYNNHGDGNLPIVRSIYSAQSGTLTYQYIAEKGRQVIVIVPY